MAALDQLMTELRSDGALDSKGEFTLDREQARSKMQKFQFADARRYVLELVQAATLRGAESIDFDIDADDMRMRFDGEPFTAAEFDDLYGSLFNDAQGRRVEAVRQLALALNAAMGMAPRHIEVHSGSVGLRMIPGREDAILELAEPVAGTRVHVRQRLGGRVLLDFFRKFAGRLEEQQYLRARCVHARPRVALGADPISISGGGWAPEALAEMGFDGPNFSGRMALVAAGEVATLRLVKSGVWIDSRALAQYGTHLVAFAESDALRKDVSQAAIVQDQTCVALIDALGRERWKLWARALHAEVAEAKAAQPEPEPKPESPLAPGRVQGWLMTQLLDHAERAEVLGDPVALELCAQLWWPDCRGPEQGARRVSLRELIDLIELGEGGGEGGGGVRYATRRYTSLPAQGDPILLMEHTEAARMRKLLGPPDSVTVELTGQLRREQGRLAWLERVGEPVLPAHLSMLERVSFEFELDPEFGAELGAELGAVRAEGAPALRVRGEVGIDTDLLTDPRRDHPLRAWFFKDGRLLGRAEFDVGIPNLWLAVEGPFAPNDYFDGVQVDARYASIVAASLARVGEALPKLLARARSEDHQAAVRGMAKRWLALMLVPGRLQKVLEIVGLDEELAEVWALPGAALAPELDLDGVLAGPVPALAQLPLFLDFEGNRISLAQVAALVRRDGTLAYLPWRTELEPLEALPGVLRLGIDDRATVEAFLGPGKLRSWAQSLSQRRARARFLSEPEIGYAAAWERMAADYRAQGIDPQLLSRALTAPRSGLVMFIYEPELNLDELGDSLDSGRLNVFVEGRSLVSEDFEFGVPMVMACVEDPQLAPTPTWDDFERESRAFIELRQTLRERALDLVLGLCAAQPSLPTQAGRRWLGAVLLNAAAKAHEGRGKGRAKQALRQALRELALIPTVDGRTLSLAALEADLAKSRRLLFVDADHSFSALREPTVYRLEGVTLAALTTLLGEVFEDGTERVRLGYLAGELDARPALTEARLDAARVWGTQSVADGRSEGVIALSRTRTQGMRVTFGTAGRMIAVVESESPLPLDAVILDKELPLSSASSVDAGSKRVRGHLRRCRRQVPALVLGLCRELGRESDPGNAEALVLAHIHAELSRDEERRDVRRRALERAMGVAVFTDVFGRRWSAVEILEFCGGEGATLDILERGEEGRGLGSEFADSTARSEGWLVLATTPPQREVLEHLFELRLVQGGLEGLTAELRRRGRVPRVERPADIEAVSIVHRQAQASGGLMCLLWIPVDHSPFADGAPRVVFARGERVVGWEQTLAFMPCRGIVTGAGFEVDGGTVVLSAKSRASLERQVAVLYEGLISKVESGGLPRAQRGLALEYLGTMQAALDGLGADDPARARLGKRVNKLSARVERLIPRSLQRGQARARSQAKSQASQERAARAQAEEAEAEAETEVEVEVAAAEAEAAAQGTATVDDGAVALVTAGAGDEVSPGSAAALPQRSPSERLLAALDEGLRWARERHGSLLDDLALARVRLGPCDRPRIADPSMRDIVVNQEHPVVAHLLRVEAGQALDPVDLSFVISAVYTLMNRTAEGIVDDDERTFVAQLAETLALRARSRSSEGSRAP